MANDPIAIKELNEGIDFHSKNQAYFNLPSRLIAKVYLFRVIYRGTGWAFSKDPDFKGISADPDFWDRNNEKFYQKYKGIDQCHIRWAQLVAERKPIISPLGREWMIPLNDDGNIPWTVLTNYPVQGTGADIVKIARLSLWKRLRESGKSAILVGTVHDDIRIDCPNKEVDDVVKICYDVFDDIPMNVKRLWGIDLPIKFPGEVYVGNNFRHMELAHREHG